MSTQGNTTETTAFIGCARAATLANGQALDTEQDVADATWAINRYLASPRANAATVRAIRYMRTCTFLPDTNIAIATDLWA